MPVRQDAGLEAAGSMASSSGPGHAKTATKGHKKSLNHVHKHNSNFKDIKDTASLANGQSIELSESSAIDLEGKPKAKVRQPVFSKPIMGDVFGSTTSSQTGGILGMMYQSRVQADEIETLRAIGKGESNTDYNSDTKKAKEVVDDLSVFEDNSDDEPESFEGLNSRQQLALTIRNWSTMEENDEYIIEEGAVHALIGLATMDDNFIKKCCAKALDNLASRERNREQLLNLGSATGVIQIAMGARDYKIAKLCARTLCSLSMFQHGEAVMARDGAILALVILLGLKGGRLLPIAAQSLYNLTCVKDHFKGMERTVKAFLSIPSSTHDTSAWFLKSLVNCCRYSWIRMRLIEDGSLAGIASVVQSLGSRKDQAVVDELVLLIARSMRMLSESVGCRIELLAKGALPIIKGITVHSNEASQVVIAKALYNIVQHPLNNHQFLMSAYIACDVVEKSTDPIVMEYISACFHSFASEGLRNDTNLANNVMDALPRCLAESSRPLTQYYSVTTAGNLFFMKGTNIAKLETLIERVIVLGETVSDPEAIEALAVALAKLTQDEYSMAILEKKDLFDMMLKLVLYLLDACTDSNKEAKETCPIAICRTTLKLGNEKLSDDRKYEVAKALLALLHSESDVVLGNAIWTMRALGDSNICQKEFLSIAQGTLFTRIATIVRDYGSGNKTLCRNCCALIAGFSYLPEAHESLSQPDVTEMLFLTTKSDDTITREIVAITICNMTVSPEATNRLIDSGVCEIVATLSGATSEGIQELCAKCICNLTCAVKMHKEIISHGVLQTILLIALVRTVEDRTKLLCARAIMNLLSDSNIDSLKEAGVIRVFASIAAVLNHNTQIQCAQGFLIFSITEERRDDVCSRKPVLQALFLMIKSTSPQCRILVGMTVCNLLSCHKSQKLAIAAGALQVLKIISTMEYPQLREASARVIINLIQVKSLYPALRYAPVVPMINYILHKSGIAEAASPTGAAVAEPSSAHIFDCAVHAMSSVSQAEMFREHMYEKDGVAALVTSVLAGKVKTAQTATEVIRTWTLLSYQFDHTPELIDAEVILASLVLYRTGLVTPESAEMIAILFRNCSTVKDCRAKLIEKGAIMLVRGLQTCMVDRSIAIARCVIIAAEMFSKEQQSHISMVEHGIVAMLYDIVHPVYATRAKSQKLFPINSSQSFAKFAHNDTYAVAAEKKPKLAFDLSSLDMDRLCRACKNLSESSSVHSALVEGQITTWIEKFLSGPIEDSARANIAQAMCNISSSKSCRDQLVGMNANQILLDITKDTESLETKSFCQIALSNLSEITRVSDGAVSSLLELTVNKEDDVDSVNGDDIGIHDGTALSAESHDLLTKDDAVTLTDTNASAGNLNGKKKSVKSLRQMIKDGLLSNKNKQILKQGGEVINGVLVSSTVQGEKASKLEEHVAAFISTPAQAKSTAATRLLVGRLRNITSHDMDSADSIQREKDELKHSYKEHEFQVYSNFGTDFGVEQGGVAAKHEAHLGLPTISQKKDRESEDETNALGGSSNSRTTGLTKLEISQDSLTKDLRVLDIDAIAEATAAAEKEAEEKEAALQKEKEETEAALLAAQHAASAAAEFAPEDGRFSPSTSGKKPGSRSTLRGRSQSQRVSPNKVTTVKGAGAAWGNDGSGKGGTPGSMKKHNSNSPGRQRTSSMGKSQSFG